MKYLAYTAIALAALAAGLWVGLLVKPGRFEQSRTSDTTPVRTVPIPKGLPEPVALWFHAEYPDGLPVYDTISQEGTGIMRVGGLALPFRHRLEVRPDRGFYRQMDVTWWGVRILQGLDTCVDGVGVMKTPVGPAEGPNIDQGATVVAWLENLASPGSLALDPRVRWEPVDAHRARLVFPSGSDEDSVTVVFDPQTHVPSSLEALRYRNPDDTVRTRWTARLRDRRVLRGGLRTFGYADARWDGDARPWAEFTFDSAAGNAAVPNLDEAISAGGVKIGAAR